MSSAGVSGVGFRGWVSSNAASCGSCRNRLATLRPNTAEAASIRSKMNAHLPVRLEIVTRRANGLHAPSARNLARPLGRKLSGNVEKKGLEAMVGFHLLPRARGSGETRRERESQGSSA